MSAKVEQWIAEHIPDQTGKVVVITGANSGLGFEMTDVLAAKGAKVIMACRNPAKAESAVAALKHRNGNAKLEVRQLDVASLDSIRAFAEDLLGDFDQIDLLMNNAGIMGVPQRDLTVDGFEAQFGVNHLGAFALTGLLMPALEAAPAARVVSTASVAHRNTKGLQIDNLNFENGGYSPFESYARSKLANLCFTFELDKRLKAKGSSVIATAGHPGYAASNIGSAANPNDSAVKKMFFQMGNVFALPTRKGALSMLAAACDPALKGGDYFGPQGPLEFWGWPDRATPKATATDAGLNAELWTKSEAMTGVAFP